MNRGKRKRLEQRGWKIGNADDYLELTPEESRYLDLKLALSDKLRTRRQEKNLTQKQFADRLGSSQSRVAKMEAGDPSVSIDLMFRSLFSLGATRQDLARIVAARRRPRTA